MPHGLTAQGGVRVAEIEKAVNDKVWRLHVQCLKSNVCAAVLI